MRQPGEYPALRVSAMNKTFSIGGAFAERKIRAVNEVDLEIYAGETLALVGESGSGKSTLARCIVRLIEPDSGEVELDGKSIALVKSRELPTVYRDMQMVFQDPNSSLNPRMTVRQIIEEPLRLHLHTPKRDRRDVVRRLLSRVGLQDAHLDRLPHQLSGGQRQRVGIARALAVQPKVLILDEPTSSLDVSVRGQILQLLADLQEDTGLAYLFITHDLQVARRLADRVAVMYLGRILEQGTSDEVFGFPSHPYTKALLSAAPIPEWGARKERYLLSGEIPSPIDVPDGCPLSSRCPLVIDECRLAPPPLLRFEGTHDSACPITTANQMALT